MNKIIALRDDLTKSIKYCSYLQNKQNFYNEMTIIMAYQAISPDTSEERFAEEASTRNLTSCLLSHKITSNDKGIYFELNGFDVIEKLEKLIPTMEEFNKHFFNDEDSPFNNINNLSNIYNANHEGFDNSTTQKIKCKSRKIKTIGHFPEGEHEFIYMQQLRDEVTKRTEYYS